MKVLTVGDGDFSFSLALARLGVVLTATSYESRATLENVYPDIQQTLIEMKRLGATILFQVDATNLARTLPKKYYERIVWNFPCSAIAKGQDGQNKEMDWNKELVRRFVANARDYAAINCQIHINHKTKV
jgi:25S rRNA (uracil2634-N3)-methyltransferase